MRYTHAKHVRDSEIIEQKHAHATNRTIEKTKANTYATTTKNRRKTELASESIAIHDKTAHLQQRLADARDEGFVAALGLTAATDGKCQMDAKIGSGKWVETACSHIF
jgi:hypothetical protein